MKKIKSLIVIAIMTVMVLGSVMTAHAGGCGHNPMRGISVGWCTTGNGCGQYAYLYECGKCGAKYAMCDRGHYQ